jgi:hypothetical protein
MPKGTSILQLSRRLRTNAEYSESPRMRGDLRLASELLKRLAIIIEEALTRAGVRHESRPSSYLATCASAMLSVALVIVIGAVTVAIVTAGRDRH